jgi:uncharacterized protein YjdB
MKLVMTNQSHHLKTKIMKNKLNIGLVLFLTLTGFLGYGQASITTVADSFIQGEAFADTNFGTLDLVIKSVGTNERVTRYGFVKFDLSDIPTELAIVKLRLTVKDTDINSFEAFMVADDSWTESDITWNNAPAAVASLGVQTNSVSDPVLEWDIRKEVLAELTSDQTITIKIVGTLDDIFSNIHSKESTTVAADKPTIVYLEGEFIFVTSIGVDGAEEVNTVAILKSLQMISTIAPTNATSPNVFWSVAAGTGSATIDTNGLLTGQTEGTVMVTATATDGSGVLGQKEIFVKKISVTSIAIDGTGGKATANIGSTLQMTATVLPADAANPRVSWEVADDTGSATIYANGFLMGKTVGFVTVTATANDGSGVSSQKEILVDKATPGITSLVSVDSQGNLSYTADDNGNVIPDFSMVGYHQGDKAIPDVPVKVTLNPGTGDQRSNIQNAINTVAAMTPDVNGHRGTILLTAGYYEVSDVLNINVSGIVIRGEGKDANGTVVELTATKQTDLFRIGGSTNASMDLPTEKNIIDPYVAIGAKNMAVASGHVFQIGDRVLLKVTTNAAWVALLGMDQLATICGEGHSSWAPGSITYKRKVTDVNGDLITLDAPVVDPIDVNYNTATLAKYTWAGKIEECGIENIRLLSSYASATDENHGWTAVSFSRIENSWAKDIDAYYFGYSAVETVEGAYQITVQDCGMYDYKSVITGGRRYGFYSDDCDLVLFKNCVATQGRHDFVQGSKTPGPNVYLNCSSTGAFSDVGPHHRWSVGTLWDNVSTDKAINVQNRMCSGSGHGWAGAQQVVWNCTAPNMVLHDPPSNATNWAIGFTGSMTNVGQFDGVIEPFGVVESQNTAIKAIPSLYQTQLRARFPITAPTDLVAEVQGTQIDLSWTDNSDNEEGFIVERKENGAWKTITTLAPNVTSYSDSNIPVLYEYAYRVRSTIATAISVASNEVALSVLLAEPSDLSAVAQGTQIDLLWTDNSDNEDGFLVEREDAGVWTSVATLAANTMVYSDVDIPVLYNYTYRVFAMLSGEVSVKSNEVTVSEVLAEPGELLVTAQESQIDLSWMDNSSLEDGFLVERKELNTWTPIVILAANTTNFSDINIPDSYEYTYRVFTTLGAEKSIASNEAKVSKELTLNITNTKALYVYPNPSNDKIVIDNIEKGTLISIYNQVGQLVMEKEYEDAINISSLASGMYFLHFNDGINNQNGSLRFIKNEEKTF